MALPNGNSLNRYPGSERFSDDSQFEIDNKINETEYVNSYVYKYIIGKNINEIQKQIPGA